MEKGKVTVIGKSEQWRQEEEERALGKWRIHNGEEFVRAYDTEEAARKAAHQFRAIAIGKLYKDEDGQVYYTDVERILHIKEGATKNDK